MGGVKAFRADLALANDAAITGVANISKGESDGEAVFNYCHEGLASPVRIQLLSTSVDGYPRSSSFMVFTTSENVPAEIAEALQALQESTFGKDVVATTRLISRKLTAIFEPDAAPPGSDEKSERQTSDEDDHYDDEDDDDGNDGDAYDGVSIDSALVFSAGSPNSQHSAPSSTDGHGVAGSLGRGSSGLRFRQDLVCATNAGLRLGVYPGTSTYSLSLRLDKLGMPDETLEAWNVGSEEYVVLLFKQNGPYRSLEQLLKCSDFQKDEAAVQFAFGKCARFKPSALSVRMAFMASAYRSMAMSDSSSGGDAAAVFTPIQISNTINSLLREDLVPLLKLRLFHDLSWKGARQALTKSRDEFCTIPEDDCDLPERFRDDVASLDEGGEEFVILPTAPAALNRDHVSGDFKHLSVPLIAMQLALLYFARCTEHCMVCLRPVDQTFQAIKPYVCPSQLCLFQYTAMGLGPSVEHEVVHQPYVVDILVNFFYQAAQCNRVRDWPKGLALKVPRMSGDRPQVRVDPLAGAFFGYPHSASLREGQHVLLLRDDISNKISSEYIQCRVTSVGKNCVNFDFICVSTCLIPPHGPDTVSWTTVNTGIRPEPDRNSSLAFAALLHLFDQDLDDVPTDQVALPVQILLHAIPPVLKMRSYLLENPSRRLANWPLLSASSLALLRWIITSNRSSIVQLDPVDGEAKDVIVEATSQQKIRGLGDKWMQFRFAQGSANKEYRFELELGKISDTSKPAQSPTLFAWHGSAKSNWHSIIREGLNFTEMQHGRSYGDGVYFSPFFVTSEHYSTTGNGNENRGWPNCEVKFTAVLSLCEIVNRPSKFVNTTPHIVVSEVDWIQVRYLLVNTPAYRSRVPTTTTKDVGASPELSGSKGAFLVPDKLFPLCGPVWNRSVDLPIAIVPKSRRSEYAFQDEHGCRLTEESIQAIQEASCNRPAREQGSAQDDRPRDPWTGSPAAAEEADDSEWLMSPAQAEGSSVNGAKKRSRSGESRDGSDMYASSRTPKRHVRGNRFEPSDVRSPAQEAILLDPTKTTFRPGTLDFDVLPQLAEPSWASPMGSRHLAREIASLRKAQAENPLHELGWYLDLQRVTNLYHWIVELHSFDAELPLAKDMREIGICSIVVEIRFGKDYPMSPPFLRVIRPRFVPFLKGGGGHVTAGGAMCMELLTATGWSPANCMESVLVQVRTALSTLEPYPARLLRGTGAGEYSVGEAQLAFQRAARAHNWAVPGDFMDMFSDSWNQGT